MGGVLDRVAKLTARRPPTTVTLALLSTGVDVPTCKDIVLARPVNSIVEFKQIIGRGTRLLGPQKTWFTIVDYAGATRHFYDEQWDGDPQFVDLDALLPAGPPTAPEAGAAEASGASPSAASSGFETPASASQEQGPDGYPFQGAYS
jgi:type I restriction enzyme, R subunit